MAIISQNCQMKTRQKTMSDEKLFFNSSAQADSLISKMTLEEKVLLIGGIDNFYSQAIPRLGIKRVMMTDATGGVHLRDEFIEKPFHRAMEKSTEFPAPIALAASWNKNLALEYAKSIGEECRAAGIPVLLGPGMNIYRISQCGRNFEYFGEDPYLSGEMIKYYVTGLQSTGTIATLKHFVTNNTDFFRRKSNSIVDERTLHEIYLPAFKAGIDAGAKAVMTSYNQLNGEWCGQSEYVINQLLRKELGFKWMVMTDWWSVYNGEKLIKSGQNIEMPAEQTTKDVLQWIEEGKISEEQIDKMIKPTLTTFIVMNAFNAQPDSTMITKFPQHEEVALQTAREGVVLLKNDNQLLPIRQSTDHILAMGYYLDSDLKGGGSAEVEGYNHVSFRQALQQEFGNRITVIEHPEDDKIRDASCVILSIGTQDSEGYDRPFELPREVTDLIHKVSTLNNNVIVVVNSGSGIRMTDWNDKVGAIIYGWYPGQNGYQAIAEVISGEVNPSGKLPMSIEKEFSDTPGYGYMNGEPFYVGWNGEGERAHPVYDINYDEGILVGYRWFDTKKIEPLYPFGFGLSYTSFNIENLKLTKMTKSGNDLITVEFDITNIGDLEGAEVVQLYISDKECSVLRPVKELKGFEKVSLIPGEKQKVSFELSDKDFAFYDPSVKKWVMEPGDFEILIGTSSRDIKLYGHVVRE